MIVRTTLRTKHSMTDELPAKIKQSVATYARRELNASSEEEAAAFRSRRERVLDRVGYRSRFREDDARVTLVCYPSEWVEAGTANLAAIDDLDRAVEIPIEGAGDPDDWDEVDAENRAVAERVAAAHGPEHGRNAEAFATFMSNHRARRIETATAEDVEEFLEEYYVRNVWPTRREETLVAESVSLARTLARDQT